MARRKKKKQEPAPSRPVSPRVLFAAALVLGLAAWFVLQLGALGAARSDANNYTYNGRPILANLDGYHFLARASQPGEDSGSSLLTDTIAVISKVTGASLEKTGFCLPPILASGLVVVFVLWGHFALDSILAGLIAAMFASVSLYWGNRTAFGVLDTDCLNPVLVGLASIFAYKFAFRASGKRWIWLAAALAACLLLGLWWMWAAAALTLGLMTTAYGLSFFLPSGRSEKILKLALAGGAVLAGAVVVLGYRHLPAPLSDIGRTISRHLHLIGKKPVYVYPEVGRSISELAAPSLKIVIGSNGHYLGIVPALIGLALLVRDRPAAGVFLVPMAGLGLIGLITLRFMIFLTPVMGLGFGYALYRAANLEAVKRRVASAGARTGPALGLAALLLIPAASVRLANPAVPPVDARDAALAQGLGNKAGQGAMVWSWWDYGYFLEYMTGRDAFIDGGSQIPDRTFAAAFPLACDDPELARNWIRYFTARDLSGLYLLDNEFADYAKTVEFLKQALKNRSAARKAIADFGLKDEEHWLEFLFPEDVTAYVYITGDMIKGGYWWYYYGTWDIEKQAGTEPRIGLFGTKDYRVNEQEFVLVGNQGALGLGRVIRADKGNIYLSESDPGRDANLISIEGDEHYLLVDNRLFDCLAVRLAFRQPVNTPYFTPVAFDPLSGGVWRVE